MNAYLNTKLVSISIRVLMRYHQLRIVSSEPLGRRRMNHRVGYLVFNAWIGGKRAPGAMVVSRVRYQRIGVSASDYGRVIPEHCDTYSYHLIE